MSRFPAGRLGRSWMKRVLNPVPEEDPVAVLEALAVAAAAPGADPLLGRAVRAWKQVDADRVRYMRRAQTAEMELEKRKG